MTHGCFVRIALFLALAICTTLVTPSPALAQETATGDLVVTVTDSTGASLSDAAVLLTRDALRRTATSGGDGRVRFAGLAVGPWTMTVTREGFAPLRQTVVVEARPLDVPIALSVAGFSESVEVGGAAGPPTQIPLAATASGGSRLDIPVRDLPASLFMVSQQLIQDRGARSVEEAVQLAVGMQASTGVGSIPGYSTRGWGGNNISVMRDGVRQNSQSQSSRPVDPFLLERVEVLKGPASLLYGEGAIGGAINLVTKSPIASGSVDSLVAYGSYGQYRAGIGVNAPLRRNLFARVDVSQSGSDGYVGDSPQKLAAASASLRWLPTPGTSIKASAMYTYDDTSAYYATPFVNGTFDRRMRDINYNMADRLTKSHNKWFGVEAQSVFGGGWTFHNQLFVATHALDWHNFEGYTYNPTLNTVDVSSFFLIWRSDLLVGNRATLRNRTSIAGRDLSVLVGGEVQRNDMERAGNPSPNPVIPVRRLDPLNPQPHFDPGFGYARQRDVLIETKALFAESVFELATRLKVVGGARWEAIDLGYTPYPSRVTANQTYEPTTGRVGTVFEVTSNTNVYASYSRAVEPTTQLVSLDGSQQRFSLVPGRQLEVGAKGSAFGDRLTGTFAYFDIEKRDLLVTQLIDGIQTAQQIGRQSSRGIELALVARPTNSLTLSGDVAFTGAEFGEFVELIGGVNTVRTGNTPTNVPQVIWNISPMQRIGRFDLTATLRQVGKRWGDNANTRRVGGFTTIDAAVGFRVATGTRLMLRGRNLTDRLYTQSISNTAGRLEPPRSVDLTFTTDLRPWGR